MLDVHPPHKAAHSWRDFFIHIATIVLGLLIAIGLEQTVELFHHHHQVEQVKEALRSESIENRDIERADLASLRLLIENLRSNRAALRSAVLTNGSVPYAWQQVPAGTGWLPLVDSAWLTARDSDTFSLLPPELVRNRWRVEYTIQQTNTLGLQYFDTLYDLRSAIHQHGADIRLTPEERLATLQELTRLDGQLRHLYSSVQYFDSTNELYLHQTPINMQTLMQSRQNDAKPPTW